MKKPSFAAVCPAFAKLALLLPSLSLPPLLLDSCLVGPDFKAPEMALPAAFRFSENAGLSLSELSCGQWMSNRGMQQLLQEAYASNRSLQSLAAHAEAARYQVMQTAAPIFPWFSYGGSMSKGANQSGGSSLLPNGGRTMAPAAGFGAASWELDLWGGLRRSVEAARADAEAQRQQLRAFRLSLLRQVSTGYLQLLMLDEQRRIAEAAVKSYRETLDLFAARYEGGISDLLQLQSAQAALSAAKAQLPELDKQIAAMENTLSTLAGRSPGPIARSGSLADFSAASRLPAAVPAEILAQRPDVLQAMEKLHAANAMVGVAVADFFPKIQLSTVGGAATADLKRAALHKSGWGIGVSFSGPLFRAGSLYAAHQMARCDLKAAAAEYENTVFNALAEVSDTLEERLCLKRMMEQEEESVHANLLALAISRDRYKQGLAAYYEVLTAQQNLFPAEMKLASYRCQYAACIPTLYAELGGAWKAASSPWATEEGQGQ